MLGTTTCTPASCKIRRMLACESLIPSRSSSKHPAATHLPSVAMHDSYCSFLSIAGFQSVHMTLNPASAGLLLVRYSVPSEKLIQDLDSLVVLSLHCHCFFHTDIFDSTLSP